VNPLSSLDLLSSDINDNPLVLIDLRSEQEKSITGINLVPNPRKITKNPHAEQHEKADRK
jgi:hypothetical protein